MENHNGLIKAVSGRSGTWFTYNDMTAGGMQSPAAMTAFTDTQLVPAVMHPMDPDGTSNWAARTNGSGYPSYVGMGFNMNDPPATGARTTYDASKYTGFFFYAKVGSPSTTSVTFAVPTRETDAAGGVCTKCGDHYGAPLTLSTSWQSIKIPFSSLAPGGWGLPSASWDPQHVYGCTFQVPGGTQFDVWIDDIYFTTP
jgi:hypothetical protein